jgi:hypothetical protein
MKPVAGFEFACILKPLSEPARDALRLAGGDERRK